MRHTSSVRWRQVQTGTQIVQVGTIHHDEAFHYEQKVVRDGYDETVTTGYSCRGCGVTK